MSKPKPKIDPLSKKEICEIGRDGKYLYNSHAREFGDIVERRCVDVDDFYPTWKIVPYNIKVQWFEEFLLKYSHLGYTREKALSTFINYGKDSYKNVVSKMKTTWKMKTEMCERMRMGRLSLSILERSEFLMTIWLMFALPPFLREMLKEK